MALRFEQLSCAQSVPACLLLACLYVGSLYVWRHEMPRDHPDVIKRRFTSVLVVSALAPFYLWLWSADQENQDQSWGSLLETMGIHTRGLLPAIVLPLLLTAVLFLGPIVQLTLDCPWDFVSGVKVLIEPRFWALCVSDIWWVRNHVVAPLTEELVFRACMLPLLVPCTGPTMAVFACPLFFGVAHFHHVIEQLKFKQGSVEMILLSAAFQFSYTSVFGAYTAFLFMRTGHLVGPVLCHSFCNQMGFPPVAAALEHPRRSAIAGCYVSGLVLFLLLLHPITQPAFYADNAFGLLGASATVGR
ncbi:CAAX prenyl protease 2 isoform X2 [Lampetra fluviatilis]